MDQELESRRRDVAVWSSYLAFEDRPYNDLRLLGWDVMPGVFDRLLRRLPGLIFITGSQGVGKSCLLFVSAIHVRDKGFKHEFFKFGSVFLRREFELRVQSGFTEFVFVDLPDYPSSGGSRLRSDLDLIEKAYYRESKVRSTFVVTVQKELYGGHYLFGKGEKIEVKRVRAKDLVWHYVSRFGDPAPFTGDSLMAVAEASRGVFRRFFRYMGLCLRGTSPGSPVGSGDVARVLTTGVVMDDMGLELSSFLRGDERSRAVLLLESLRVDGVGNQKEVAVRLGLSEANLSRLAAKLEGRGYLRRVRGERKELVLEPLLD